MKRALDTNPLCKYAYIPKTRTLYVVIDSSEITFRDSIRTLQNEILTMHNGKEFRLPMETNTSDSVPVTNIEFDFAKVQFISRAAMDEYLVLKDALTPLIAVAETNMNTSIIAMHNVVRKTH